MRTDISTAKIKIVLKNKNRIEAELRKSEAEDI